MKTIVFDMYGVIIKESKGNFIPYTLKHFPKSEHERIFKQIKVDQLFTKAGNGEISSDAFLTELGYVNPTAHMRDYIENYLTMDTDFYVFADRMRDTYHYALLSNDVSDWSKYITAYYNLDAYFTAKVVSADVHCRKPAPIIYEIALKRLGVPANECIFIDNSVENLQTASKLGMDVILFNRDNEPYNGQTVYSFEELARMLP